MATPEDLGGIADRLLRGFLAPLVLGGPMTPGKPIGAKVAVAIGVERVAGDPDLLSHIELARVRVARSLVPVDRLPDMTPAEWTLGAALHDIVQSSHPDFAGAFKKRSAGRLLDLVEATLEQVPDAATLGETLSRHTWFSRLFEISRNDTVVESWATKQAFLGEEPPRRLLSWPKLRRVHVVTTAHSLVDLPQRGGRVDPLRLAATLQRFLSKTPLTDLATCTRVTPKFGFTPRSLALIAAPFGRTLSLHALTRLEPLAVDRALGRALRPFLAAQVWSALDVASSLLAERALIDAISGPRSPRVFATENGLQGPAGADQGGDAAFARAVGALAAREMVLRGELSLRDDERGRVLTRLEGAAKSQEARDITAALAAGAAKGAAATSPS